MTFAFLYYGISLLGGQILAYAVIFYDPPWEKWALGAIIANAAFASVYLVAGWWK